jgi:hypothetical protein
VKGSLRVAWLVLAGILLLARANYAQVKIGDFSTNLSGTVSSGYTADFGNLTNSNHSWAVGGTGTFSGFFYNPNFVSFNISPYLNQSRANSNFQSISNASGINASSRIFGGSHFPGTVSYSKAYNSEGNYAVPGFANYVTHGDSDSFGVNWSENLPDAPSFSAGYQLGSSKYSVYGTNDEGSNKFHSLNLNSGYKWAGFNMGAYYSKGGGRSQIPQLITGESVSSIHTDNSSLGVNVTHFLPLRGSFTAGFNRTDFSTDYLGASTSGTIDTVNANAAVHPTGKTSFTATANYSDNLSGQLLQSIAAGGGVIPGLNSKESSSSLDLMGVGSYSLLSNLQTSAFIERRTQNFLGENFGVTSYGGSAYYGHHLLEGTFNGSFTFNENNIDKTGENTLGFSSNANYSSQILGWQVNGTFGYAQNVQTMLITYMNSFYNYSGSARRRWGKLNLGMGAGASRTALTSQAGTANTSESFTATTGYGTIITATGSYSKSDGQALITGTGLVPIPIPTPILPSSLVSIFGGNSYSFGLSSAPGKRLVLSASYAKSASNTLNNGIASSNENNEFNALIQYQVRKLSFVSGSSRLQQGFSSSGTKPEVITSYYFGLSRWFNFF